MYKININEEFLSNFKCRKADHLDKLIEYIC